MACPLHIGAQIPSKHIRYEMKLLLKRLARTIFAQFLQLAANCATLARAAQQHALCVQIETARYHSMNSRVLRNVGVYNGYVTHAIVCIAHVKCVACKKQARTARCMVSSLFVA